MNLTVLGQIANYINNCYLSNKFEAHQETPCFIFKAINSCLN